MTPLSGTWVEGQQILLVSLSVHPLHDAHA